MDQAFDAFFQFHENTVIGDADDLSHDPGFNRVFFLDIDPGIVGSLFEAKRNPFLIFVELEDHDLDLISDREHFGRVVDPSPGHICDV